MTGVLVSKNSHFVELTNDEMMFVDGGNVWKALEAAAGAIIIGCAPLVGIGTAIVTPVIGIPAGIAAGAGMISYGAGMIDNALKR